VIKTIDERIRKALGSLRFAFRGVLTNVGAGAGVQLAQIDGVAGEQLQDAELMQHYGITSNPPAGSMVVVLPLGGKTAHGIVIATEHASYRLAGLASGEVAIYSDEGDSVVLKRGRVIEVTTHTLRINAAEAVEINTKTLTVTATADVTLTTPTQTVSGQIVGQGGLAISGGSGSTARIDGSIEVVGGDVAVSGGDVSADGIGLKPHHHHTPSGDSGEALA
jgi:phage baseplate assembly protein V